MPKQLIVTHFQCRSPEVGRWVRLVFLTQDHDPDPANKSYFVGFETGRKIDTADPKAFVPIEFRCDIRHDQRLWLSSVGDVWLADAEDPIGDRKKIRLDSMAHSDLRPNPAEHFRIKPIYERVADRSALTFVECRYLPAKSNYKTFAGRVTKSLARIAGTIPVSLRSLAINYDSLAYETANGRTDFCEDPFFLHGPRKNLVGLVQFGVANNFACVVKRTRLPPTVDQILNQASLSMRDRVKRLLNHHTLELGLYNETAATHEVEEQLSAHTELQRTLFKSNSSVELAAWLQEKGKNKSVRLFFCDVGIAHEVARHLGDVPTIEYQMPYNSPVPVGFLFPLGDLVSRDNIVEAIHEALDKSKFPWEGPEGSISDELEDKGIHAFSLEQLCKNLGFRVTHVTEKNTLACSLK